MVNLRDLRIRMKAIRQTLQVTKAMKLISTAKLRKCRRILQDTEPYFVRIQKLMFDILSSASMDNSKFFSNSSIKSSGENIGENIRGNNSRTAIIVISSDKGLAGGYNANIFHQVNELCAKALNPVLILIGTIGYRYFFNSQWLVLENFSFKSKLPEMDDAKAIADYVIAQYLWGMFDEVHIIYTHMYSSIKLIPRERQLLPLNKEKLQEELDETGVKRVDLQFEFWPSREEVFDHLVPMYIKGIIYGSLVEAYVSEQSARMSAMDEASKSAEEMLASLHMNYNRARQSEITQQITEISGGAEALKRKIN